MQRFSDWCLRILAEHPELRAVRLLRALTDALPWVSALASYRLGDLSGARARLRCGKGSFTWERALALRIDEMLALRNASQTPPGPGGDRVARPVRRILYVVDVDAETTRSGYTRRTDALLHALQLRGIEVLLALRPGHGRADDVEAATPRLFNGLRRIACGGQGPTWRETDTAYLERFARCLQRIVQSHDIDLIHAASPFANGLAANLAAARCGIASVYEMRGLWHWTRALREPGYTDSQHFRYWELQEARASIGATRTLVLSEPMAEWLTKQGVSRSHIDIVGNAKERSSRSVACATIVAPRSEFNIGYAGALVGYEGLGNMLHAMASAELLDARLWIAGDGIERRRLERAARTLGVSARVEFCGVLQDDALKRFYERLDVVVVPRVDLPLTRLVPSLKPFEAMARGIPLVISDAAASALDGGAGPEAGVFVFSSLQELVPALLRARAAPRCVTASVPDWDDRAAQVVAAYARC